MVCASSFCYAQQSTETASTTAQGPFRSTLSFDVTNLFRTHEPIKVRYERRLGNVWLRAAVAWHNLSGSNTPTPGLFDATARQEFEFRTGLGLRKQLGNWAITSGLDLSYRDYSQNSYSTVPNNNNSLQQLNINR